jgi:hypothetical protein
VLASLVVNAQALVAKEIELLGLEVRRLTTEKLTALMWLVVALITGLFVMAFLGVTLAKAIEPHVAADWIAWAIVTGIVTVKLVIAAALSARLASRPWYPKGTLTSLRDTATWARLTVTGETDATDTSANDSGGRA